MKISEPNPSNLVHLITLQPGVLFRDVANGDYYIKTSYHPNTSCVSCVQIENGQDFRFDLAERVHPYPGARVVLGEVGE